MTRGVKIRLIAFAVLAAVGILYIGAAYLGIVDAVLGRGKEVTVALPASGGLYVGSEANYRGVRIGEVSDMNVTPTGVDVVLDLEDWAEVPRSSDIVVSNLSAVGEQYINFIPRSGGAPYLADGERVRATAASLPPSTDVLLTSIDKFVRSVDPNDLQTVVSELGTMFRGNAENLRILIDSGTKFVDEATRRQDATITLLRDGGTVLATQRAEGDNIRRLARGLADVTETLKDADPDIREILQKGPETFDEINDMVKLLQPVLGPFLSNLIEFNQVLNPRLTHLGEVLAVLPTVIKNGLFYGTPGDGYGHISALFDYTVPVCSQGYLPPAQWPSPLDVREHPLFPARCADPRAQRNYTGDDPINQRGVNFAPPAVDEDNPIYNINPYKSSSSASRSASSTASSSTGRSTASAGGASSVVGQPGWESMFSGE